MSLVTMNSIIAYTNSVEVDTNIAKNSPPPPALLPEERPAEGLETDL